MSAQLTCSEHPDAMLVQGYHADHLICTECGSVVGDRLIDIGSDGRTFSNEKNIKDNSRVGAVENPLFDGADMSKMIATGTVSDSMKDEFGNPLYKNKHAVYKSNRAFVIAYREIAEMEDRLNLPKMIVDRASMLFKKVHDSKAVVKGYSYKTIVSACVYTVCRQDGFPRAFKEIRAISKVRAKEMGRVFKLILKILETSVDNLTSVDFMSRFCSELGLMPAIQKTATYIAKMAAKMDLITGRRPISVAAAAIYMASQASDDKKTAKEIGDIAGVAQDTVRKVYKSILPNAMVLFPADFKFSTPVENLSTR